MAHYPQWRNDQCPNGSVHKDRVAKYDEEDKAEKNTYYNQIGLEDLHH